MQSVLGSLEESIRFGHATGALFDVILPKTILFPSANCLTRKSRNVTVRAFDGGVRSDLKRFI
jgi:hypothetical protein